MAVEIFSALSFAIKLLPRDFLIPVSSADFLKLDLLP